MTNPPETMENRMSKLKPCPFCGSEARYVEDKVLKLCYVRCESGDLCAIEIPGDTRQQAIDTWNKRTPGILPVNLETARRQELRKDKINCSGLREGKVIDGK